MGRSTRGVRAQRGQPRIAAREKSQGGPQAPRGPRARGGGAEQREKAPGPEEPRATTDPVTEAPPKQLKGGGWGATQEKDVNLHRLLKRGAAKNAPIIARNDKLLDKTKRGHNLNNQLLPRPTKWRRAKTPETNEHGIQRNSWWRMGPEPLNI